MTNVLKQPWKTAKNKGISNKHIIGTNLNELIRIIVDSKNGSEILYKEESYKIIGACMKVHRTLGAGFLVAVYEEALEMEFKNQNIPFKRQIKLPVFYGNRKLKKYYKADFVCYNKIILEIKSVQKVMPKSFYAQLKNYLVATQRELGILVNFGQSSLDYKRIINSKATS